MGCRVRDVCDVTTRYTQDLNQYLGGHPPCSEPKGPNQRTACVIDDEAQITWAVTMGVLVGIPDMFLIAAGQYPDRTRPIRG